MIAVDRSNRDEGLKKMKHSHWRTEGGACDDSATQSPRQHHRFTYGARAAKSAHALVTCMGSKICSVGSLQSSGGDGTLGIVALRLTRDMLFLLPASLAIHG